MKIGIIVQDFPPYIKGGSHVSAYKLAKGFAKNDNEVHVFTSKHGKKKIEINKENIKIYRIFKKKIYGLLKKEINSKNQFDFLISYGSEGVSAIIKLKRFTKRTAMTYVGSSTLSPFFHIDQDGEEDINDYSFLKFMRKTIKRIGKYQPGTGSKKGHYIKILLAPYFYAKTRQKKRELKKIDIIFAASKKIKKMLLNHGLQNNKVFVGRNMYEKERYEKGIIKRKFNIENKKVVLYVGRYIETKGCDFIVNTIPEVIKQEPKTHFLFIGDGHNKQKLKNKVKKLGIQNNVTIYGIVKPKELFSIYKESYVTVYPSLFFDPFPRTPNESFIAGTTVISTSKGGIPETVIHNKTGLITRIEDLEKNIIYLLKNPSLRNKLSQQAEKFSEQFLLDSQIKNYISVLKNDTPQIKVQGISRENLPKEKAVS